MLCKKRPACKNYSRNGAKIACGEAVCTDSVHVEKLCMMCERRCTSSRIFRLLRACQSETIPRGLRMAVRRPALPDGPHAEYQGQAKALRVGKYPEA